MKKLALILVAAALLGGCFSREPEPMAVYDKTNPGPWKDTTITVGFDGPRVRVSVKNFPSTPDNYVRRLSLWDDRGKNVGERVFASTDTPEETFILEPESRTVSVSITSTGQGMWRTDSITVPPVPKEEPARTPRVPIQR